MNGPFDHDRRPGRRLARTSPVFPGCRVRRGLAAAFLALGGCASPGPGGAGGRTTGSPDLPPEISVDGRPVALLDGGGVPWPELRPQLLEAAGAEVLADWILDQRLERALLDAGARVSPAMIEQEQRRLLEQLADDPDDAARLLAELRDRRNLGPVRYAALLRRNASLRALVEGSVTVGEAEIRTAFDVAHGPRRQIRLMTLPDLAAAAAARAAVIDGDRRFAEVATERSTDLSAARGGLLAPFAEREPGMPEAIRRAAFGLGQPGDISPPLLLSGGAALVQLVEAIPGDGTTFGTARDAAARDARLVAERIAMERVARQLVATATVSVLDPALRDAWERRRRRVAEGR